MGRSSSAREQKRRKVAALRVELQRNIESGQCAYCRRSAAPGSPLTREHVIAQARGGRRKDVRIIVPACAHCNHKRGCQDFIPFLLRRPRRLSSFLDYLDELSPDSLRELDPRVFAEIYAAIAILAEAAGSDADEARTELERLCSGRSLHRRRYAARRAIKQVGRRLENRPEPEAEEGGPRCVIPITGDTPSVLRLEEPLDRLASRLMTLLGLIWRVSAELVVREMKRLSRDERFQEDVRRAMEGSLSGTLRLDGWKPKAARRRLRVDRRQGRSVRPQRIAAARGRAA